MRNNAWDDEAEDLLFAGLKVHDSSKAPMEAVSGGRNNIHPLRVAVGPPSGEMMSGQGMTAYSYRTLYSNTSVVYIPIYIHTEYLQNIYTSFHFATSVVGCSPPLPECQLLDLAYNN